MLFDELYDLLIHLEQSHGLIYLVGGCVRDACLKKASTDFDLVFESNAIASGRSIADYFKGDFYVLDAKRGTGRALFRFEGKEYRADCALLNPSGIEEDLKNRDFTINAMAIQVPHFSKIIDPLGGLQDLENRYLRLCNPIGFSQDPVRILRAVRFSIDFDLQMDGELVSSLKAAIGHLSEVSKERTRDEIVNILTTKSVKNSFELINDLGLLGDVFPGVNGLFSIKQAPPHFYDGWNHTLQVLHYCQKIIEALQNSNFQTDEKLVLDAVGLLKKYQSGMRDTLSIWLNPFRDIKTLFYIAALYHDTGKPLTSPVQINGKTSYPGHETVSEKLARNFCLMMAFSVRECQFISQLVLGHMRPVSIKFDNQIDLRRSAYHFFKLTGSSGVFICILHLADILSTYAQTISPDRWQAALQVIEGLLDIWFHHYDEVINPPKLINGHEIQEKFGIMPGKQMGELLERLREEQAAGEITDIHHAYNFIGESLRRKN
jgi:tRNA nucleotidyltransferase/poly(A) polymerase